MVVPLNTPHPTDPLLVTGQVTLPTNTVQLELELDVQAIFLRPDPSLMSYIEGNFSERSRLETNL